MWEPISWCYRWTIFSIPEQTHARLMNAVSHFFYSVRTSAKFMNRSDIRHRYDCHSEATFRQEFCLACFCTYFWQSSKLLIQIWDACLSPVLDWFLSVRHSPPNLGNVEEDLLWQICKYFNVSKEGCWMMFQDKFTALTRRNKQTFEHHPASGKRNKQAF